MAKPEEKDESWNDIRYVVSPPDPSGPGPVPVRPASEIPSESLLAQHGTDQPLGEWPYERGLGTSEHIRTERSRRVENAGGAVGNVIGNVVQKARQIPSAVQDRVQDIKSHFTVISGRKKEDIAQDLKNRASNFAGTAKDRARTVQTRAQFYARESPLRFITIAAGVGFAIGFLMRMWRDE